MPRADRDFTPDHVQHKTRRCSNAAILQKSEETGGFGCGGWFKLPVLSLMVFCVALFNIVIGCGDGGHSTQFGTPISNRKVLPIASLFDNAAAYDGKTVTIQGEIDMQDPNGHWFYVQDEEARIYVEIDRAEFSIPDLAKKKVLVEGLIDVQLDLPSLLATGAEIQE